jgi:hypothetical protein
VILKYVPRLSGETLEIDTESIIQTRPPRLMVVIAVVVVVAVGVRKGKEIEMRGIQGNLVN